MKKFVMFLTVMCWLGLLSYGFTFIVQKTMKSQPEVQIEDSDIVGSEPLGDEKTEEERDRKEKTQREKALEMKQQQRQLMEERQRTLRYHQNR